MKALLFLVLAIGLALPALAQDSEMQEDGRTVPAVSLALAELAQVQAQVPVSGTLVARQPVQVFAQVSGHEVTEILAEAGDMVQQGAVLARLDSETLEAQLAQAEAEYQRAIAAVSQAESAIAATSAALSQAETALRRTQQLHQRDNVSQAVLDQAITAEAAARAEAASAADGVGVAQAAMAQADAARRIARLNLDRAQITAPVAGLVTARNAELGTLSGASPEPMFTLIADGRIELAAEVIETALPGLAVGVPAEIAVAGLGRIEGELRLVPAAVDPVTRLGLARIALPPDPRLRIGMFANGWIVTLRREGVAVPAGAVISDSSGERVLVVRDGVVESRTVRAGLLWDGRREILQGLEAGESVIARAAAFFREGDRVRAVDDGPADAAPMDDVPADDAPVDDPPVGDSGESPMDDVGGGP